MLSAGSTTTPDGCEKETNTSPNIFEIMIPSVGCRMILLSRQDQGDDRWNCSQSCFAACWCLYTTAASTALKPLSLQILLLAKVLGFLKLGKISLDGSKIQANASKHSALSGGHALELEQQLKEEVAQLMAMALC